MMKHLKKSDAFPVEDGRIKSIWIGAGIVKLVFEAWNCRQFVLIFGGADYVKSDHAVDEDIGEYKVSAAGEGKKLHSFYSAWEHDAAILEIAAESVRIYQAVNGK